MVHSVGLLADSYVHHLRITRPACASHLRLDMLRDGYVDWMAVLIWKGALLGAGFTLYAVGIYLHADQIKSVLQMVWSY